MQNAFAVPAHQRNENEATAMQTMETTTITSVCDAERKCGDLKKNRMLMEEVCNADSPTILSVSK